MASKKKILVTLFINIVYKLTLEIIYNNYGKKN